MGGLLRLLTYDPPLAMLTKIWHVHTTECAENRVGQHVKPFDVMFLFSKMADKVNFRNRNAA